MHKITFTCETITPMFLAGADGKTPELRAPSIKGALRFWWRALNGHLDLGTLKEREGKIFGSTEQQSRVIIRVLQPLNYEKIEAAMLPHKKTKRDQSWTPCFGERQSFKVQFSLPKDYLSEIKKLFILTTILGGFGKRSRRGFGSVRIMAIDEEPLNIEQNLKSISIYLNKKYFSIDEESHSIKSKNQKNNKYPYIKTIEIGKKSENYLPKDIIEAAHEVKKEEHERAKKEADQKNDFFYDKRKNKKFNIKKYSYFESSIGDGANRLASPIYISCLTNEVPIITTLNHIPPRGKSEPRHIELQRQFKKKLI